MYERVEKGCKKSGRRGAASAMMMMMLKANQKRAGLACTACHEAPLEQNYDLKDGAYDLAAKWFSGEKTTRKKTKKRPTKKSRPKKRQKK